MDNSHSFESFLHNPWKYPSREETVAMICYKRKERFVEGYNYLEELKELVLKYFGNQTNLEIFGLAKYYNELQRDVEENKLIGLILLGTQTDTDTDTDNDNNNNNISEQLNFVNNYTTKSGDKIKLTLASITQHLINDYIKKDNIKRLCCETPNFHLYYK